MDFNLIAIGTVQSERAGSAKGDWDRVNATIVLDTDVLDESATSGLKEFSHVEVTFIDVCADPTPPDPTGLLARRTIHQPNRIGTSVCELMGVRPGGRIRVRGLEASNGTPVLDVRPYFRELAPRGDVLQPDWVATKMADHWVASSDTSSPFNPDDWLAEVRRSPADGGRLDLIVRRPDVDDREVIERGDLDLDVGLVGDNWKDRGSSSRRDGSADPDAQLNIMNSRVARLVARDPDRMALAGDQLYVDLDLSEANLPAGTQLGIGSAVIEITAKPHTGCAKFTRRFGLEAHRWVNGRSGKEHRLRASVQW